MTLRYISDEVTSPTEQSLRPPELGLYAWGLWPEIEGSCGRLPEC